MLLTAAICFGAALGAFAAFLGLITLEQRRGKRVVAARLRHWCDNAILAAGQLFTRLTDTLWTVAERVGLGALRRGIYSSTPARPPHHPRRAFTSRPLDLTEHTAASAHLSALRKHRSETALTPKQKERLRNKKLEERF